MTTKKKITRKKRRTKKEIEEDKRLEVAETRRLELEVAANKGKKFLTREETHQADVLNSDIENKRLLMAVREQDLVNLNLRLELLNRDVTLCHQRVSAASTEFEAEKNKMKVFIQSMDNKYGLPNGELAYKSSTGEIIDTKNI